MSLMRMLGVAALCCLALAGCASTQPVAYEGVPSARQMAPNEQGDKRPPFRYSISDAPWPAYTGVILDSIEIYGGRDAQFNSTSDEDRKTLAAYMQEQFTDALKGRYALADASGPNTLRIHVTLTGIETNTAVLATLSKLAPPGLVINGIKSASGTQGAFTGSVSYAVDIYDSATGRLLRAYITKQYPLASSVSGSFGSLEASKVGVRNGAEELMQQLR